MRMAREYLKLNTPQVELLLFPLNPAPPWFMYQLVVILFIQVLKPETWSHSYIVFFHTLCPVHQEDLIVLLEKYT